jgi:hypothetical protein
MEGYGLALSRGIRRRFLELARWTLTQVLQRARKMRGSLRVLEKDDRLGGIVFVDFDQRDPTHSPLLNAL